MDNNWNYNPDDESKKPENERNEELLAELVAVDKALGELEDEGLKGDDLLCVWVERRISPLQKRSCSIWQMSGPMDCNRMSTFALTKDGDAEGRLELQIGRASCRERVSSPV